MLLPDGYADVPAGKIAAVVTSLEMTERPVPRPDPPEEAGFGLRRLDPADRDGFRALFRKIGEHYLWFSRLYMSDEALAAELDDPAMELSGLTRGGEDLGLLMLDFRQPREVEISFFGVADELIGTGAGRWLMNRAIERAWARPIERFWVHTCTHDHPAALGFYIRSGFRAYRRQIEIADDPRLMGHLPRRAAPQIPIL